MSSGYGGFRMSPHKVPLTPRAWALGYVLVILAPALAVAGSLDALSSKDANAGLRAALSQGVDKAIARLGAPDGFLANPKYTIPLPPALEKVDRALKLVGMSGDTEALKTAMNQAAAAAVADAKPVFKQAVQRMTLADAKGILTGGDTAATQYFRQATSAPLVTRFKPIVARATQKMKVRDLYDKYAGQASQFGLVRAQDANLNDYVTGKALDSLFDAIGEEERAIRADPLGQTSSLLKKVFGAVTQE
jgi:uncharacterized protein DUF4197